jgi:hypothetical protein
MVRMTNLDNKWVTDNTALGLVAGAGGVSWRVGELPGDVDCSMGCAAKEIDTSRITARKKERTTLFMVNLVSAMAAKVPVLS